MASRRSLNGEILIITGPPGAGKTTVANALVEELDRGVLLDGDSFFQSIRTDWIAPWDPASHEQNTTVTRAIGAAAGRFATGGYSVVVDGIVGPWLLAEVQAAAGAVIHYVVLRPSAAAAMTRATQRGEPWLVDPEPISKMYNAFAELGDSEAFVMDTTSDDLSTAVARILTALDTGRLRLG